MVIMRTKPKCETVYPWLRANLGRNCLAPLTHTDAAALAAAVQIVALYCHCDGPDVAEAFGAVVREMQPHTQGLAFHSIAHVMDWGDRYRLWHAAGLDPVGVRKCLYEPGGPNRPCVSNAAP